MKLQLAGLLVLLSTQVFGADKNCGTFFGGAPIINDMTSRALATMPKTFDDVLSTKISNFTYQVISAIGCDFTFHYSLTVEFVLKDSPECRAIFRVQEDVLNSSSTPEGGLDGLFHVKSYKVDHGFDDVTCN
jgi:hypothetical protein